VYLQLEVSVFNVELGVGNSDVPLNSVHFTSLYTYWLTERPNGLLQRQQQYTENNLDVGKYRHAISFSPSWD
jgi:hypothetical protein